jgi:hypothetical protein
MADSTGEFFDDIDRIGHVPHLDRFTGSMRLDLHENGRTDHWRVSIDRGNIRLSRGDDGPADTVISGDRALFDRIARGEIRPLSAFLRNEVTMSGEFRLLLVLERLVPGPPGAHDPRDLVTQNGRLP